jgi:hypothetical protein
VAVRRDAHARLLINGTAERIRTGGVAARVQRFELATVSVGGVLYWGPVGVPSTTEKQRERTGA